MIISKVVPPGGVTKNVDKRTHSNTYSTCPAINLVKRAKRRATRLSHLAKSTSQLSEDEKKEKAENLPTIKYYKDMLSGGECECQFLIETAADAQLKSPSSVSSENIHNVVKNLLG